jgi:5-methylcytosine-specific restriction enzyme A
MLYTVNVTDIEFALQQLGGDASTREIQDRIFSQYCNGVLPENYKSERTFRQTIQRKMEDYCPQAAGFDQSKKEGKFLRIGHGQYRIALGHNAKESTAIEEVLDAEQFIEGATKKIFVNVYERNAEARSKCIAYYGCKCFACGFDFEVTYGEIGKAFIHVHHIVPLSDVKTSYSIDPIRDLRPVCPNCHGIIHRTKISLTIEVLKAAINANKK